MLWTYQLEGRRTSYEVCQSAEGFGYELKRRHEDGREECETFATLDQLNQRIVNIERQLLADGWCLAGSVQREDQRWHSPSGLSHSTLKSR